MKNFCQLIRDVKAERLTKGHKTRSWCVSQRLSNSTFPVSVRCTIQTHREREGKAPLIPNFAARWRWAVTLVSWPPHLAKLGHSAAPEEDWRRRVTVPRTLVIRSTATFKNFYFPYWNYPLRGPLSACVASDFGVANLINAAMWSSTSFERFTFDHVDMTFTLFATAALTFKLIVA
jgi:hypothetical protein